jgi:hypothetical protein|tara:strand:+ start:2356 stop:2670 length:315 start_codon:yes stop_codon:yes gene_type:complete
LVINTEIIVNSFIRTARLRMLDVYLVKRGEKVSGEIFLRLNNLKGYSKIYTYKKLNIDKVWQVYSSDNWEKDEIIEKKLEKAEKVDEDIWILELEDKEGNYPSF